MNFWQWLAVGVGVTVLLVLWWTGYELRRNARRAKDKANAEFARSIERTNREAAIAADNWQREQRAARQEADRRRRSVDQQVDRVHSRPAEVILKRERKEAKLRDLGARYGSNPHNDTPGVDPYIAMAAAMYTPTPDPTPSNDWSGGGGDSGGGGASGSWDSGSCDSSSSSSDSGSCSSD